MLAPAPTRPFRVAKRWPSPRAPAASAGRSVPRRAATKAGTTQDPTKRPQDEADVTLLRPATRRGVRQRPLRPRGTLGTRPSRCESTSAGHVSPYRPQDQTGYRSAAGSASAAAPASAGRGPGAAMKNRRAEIADRSQSIPSRISRVASYAAGPRPLGSAHPIPRNRVHPAEPHPAPEQGQEAFRPGHRALRHHVVRCGQVHRTVRRCRPLFDSILAKPPTAVGKLRPTGSSGQSEIRPAAAFRVRRTEVQ